MHAYPLERSTSFQMNKPRSWSDLAKLMGEDPEKTMFYNSFVTRDGRNPIPEPSGDYYLSGQGAFYLSDPESVAITFRLVPGLESYLRKAELLRGRLIQLDMRRQVTAALMNFDLTSEQALNRYFGFENGSIDYTLLRKLEAESDLKKALKGRRPFGTFDNRDLRNISLRLNGAITAPEDASYRANNKAELRRGAEKFGYHIADGLEARDHEEFVQGVMRLFHRGYRKIWAKATNGYGGDLVRPIESVQEIENAYYSLKRALQKAQEFSQGLDHLNHPHSFVLEGDLSDKPGVKGILANLNVQAVIGKNGQVTPIGLSEQCVSAEGVYLGNVFDEDSDQTVQYGGLAENSVLQVGHWAASLGYQGILGIDILVAKEQGFPKAYVIDSNARPNGSTSSLLLKNYLEKNVVLNTTVELPRKVSNFDQAVSMIGTVLLYQAGKDRGVIPKMFHTVNDGRNCLPHDKVTCDIVGDSIEEVMEVVSGLREIGIKL